MFGTLHILCGRPRVLCCPRDFMQTSAKLFMYCVALGMLLGVSGPFCFFLWNEHNRYLTGLLWGNKSKLSNDSNMGLIDSFLPLLGYSDCVSPKWHFWRMTIKVKLAEKDGVSMVEVQGSMGQIWKERSKGDTAPVTESCMPSWSLSWLYQMIYFSPWYTGSDNQQPFPGKQKMHIPADSKLMEPPCSALQGLTRGRLCITPNWGKGSD